MNPSKMVLKGGPPSGGHSKVFNPVLSGNVPEEEGMYNRFSCLQATFADFKQ